MDNSNVWPSLTLLHCLSFLWLLSVAQLVSAQLTVPLSHDPAFATIPVVNVLESIFTRWSISLSAPLSILSLGQGSSTSLKRKKHKLKARLLGLENLLPAAVGTIDGLVQNLVVDPLFGGKVVKATGENGDTEWYGTLSIGNPPQTIELNFDTGSSDLFVFAPSCSSCDLTNHTAFQPSDSSTYKNSSADWSTAFGDGSTAGGYVSSDTVVITGSSSSTSSSSSSQITVPSFLFAMATSMSSSFVSATPSGLVGIAQDALASIQGGATVFSRMVQGSLLQQNLIGIRLVKGKRTSPGEIGPGGGEYTFGAVESQWIVGGQLGLTWTTVTSVNYWGIPVSDVQMGAASVLPSSTPKRVIIDTGTSLILTSQALSASIHSRIPGAYLSQSGVWIVPCNTDAPTPNLFFLIGNQRYGVPAQDLAWKEVDQSGEWCVSGVQGGVENFTVLGAMFIKNNYVALKYADASESSLYVGLAHRTDVTPIS